MLGRTAHPLVVDERIGNADIVGVVPHGYARPLDERITTKGIGQVVEIVESDTFAGRDGRRFFQ